MNDRDKNNARSKLEDAVYTALEAGMTPEDISAEVAYTLENADD